METKTNRQPFEALSRMCLNNWHYIDRKILSFHEAINFFTGHSGSGKSTIIDALQVVLYANTDGRGFFNKAAAEDSDRTLIEYLRGMINIEENNENAYVRNKDFSSTIVLEFTDTDTKRKQCVGVVFDVETATNEITRLFFWHSGALLENAYRTQHRVMSTEELKEYLARNFEKTQFYTTARNESFRRRLYDVYLGGLDAEKFPMLFKRAIPFKMNSRLEEFVREYICMEQNIHIEDMQESVLQYGRMQRRITDTMEEIAALTKVQEQYQTVMGTREELEQYDYITSHLALLAKKEQIDSLTAKAEAHKEDLAVLSRTLKELEAEQQEREAKKEELIRLIAKTGYQETEQRLMGVNQLLERMQKSRARWDETARRLDEWNENELAGNAILWKIKKFRGYEITQEELASLQEEIGSLIQEAKEEKAELDTGIRSMRSEQKKIREELSELHGGSKGYPKEVLAVRQALYQGLARRLGRAVRVEILADLVEITQERWRNAVEGYLGRGKLLLVVEPRYAADAVAVYHELDPEKSYATSVLDTEQIEKKEHPVKEHSLAHAVRAKESYVQAYLNYLLGNVIECDSVSEMRSHAVAVTDDCMLYQGYRLSHMNPRNYTRGAYIGSESQKRRSTLLKKQDQALDAKLRPMLKEQAEYEKTLSLEKLDQDTEAYMEWLSDIRGSKAKEKEKEQLSRRLTELQTKDVTQLKARKEAVEEELRTIDAKVRGHLEQTTLLKASIEEDQQRSVELLSLYEQDKKDAARMADGTKSRYAAAFDRMLSAETRFTTEQKMRRYQAKKEQAQAQQEAQNHALIEERSRYLKAYPNRSFSPFSEDNREYDRLLEELSLKELANYQKLAREQAKTALLHFKNDFLYKIRSAILDAQARKDELNSIIDKLDFGKDKYQFVFTRNHGEDGKYYDMFMDRSLEIRPDQLSDDMPDQMNLFTMEHGQKYKDQLNELMSIFIPPEDADAKAQEEARRNMEKYADYRTYLSFDMEQIIDSEDGPIRLRLSKMLKKNSGGEGQNPLYVALLASFAQAYHINMPARLLRSPTIRLVVLDEAFSKMDAEKVASCIGLIRSLEFQVIISATNDKIQNYLENVDKTFVFANPNKKSISIQEFEKREFGQLKEEERA